MGLHREQCARIASDSADVNPGRICPISDQQHASRLSRMAFSISPCSSQSPSMEWIPSLPQICSSSTAGPVR